MNSLRLAGPAIRSSWVTFSSRSSAPPVKWLNTLPISRGYLVSRLASISTSVSSRIPTSRRGASGSEPNRMVPPTLPCSDGSESGFRISHRAYAPVIETPGMGSSQGRVAATVTPRSDRPGSTAPSRGGLKPTSTSVRESQSSASSPGGSVSAWPLRNSVSWESPLPSVTWPGAKRPRNGQTELPRSTGTSRIIGSSPVIWTAPANEAIDPPS